MSRKASLRVPWDSWVISRKPLVTQGTAVSHSRSMATTTAYSLKQGDKAKGGAMDYIVNGNMTGGFAILAYPAEYRNSGIMTFLVGKDGTIYQKDLGETTSDAGAAMTEYNPGDGWKPVTGTAATRQ